MKTILTTAAIILAAATANAETINIAVGQEGRGYEARGKEIASRLSQRDIDAATVNYEGSDDISLAVCAGDAQVGIMQIDAIYARSNEGCKLQVLATYGNEHAIILFPEGGKYDDFGGLDKNARVLVDTYGSGTDLFWRTIVRIEAEHGNGSSWSEAQPVNGFTFMADAMASAGEIDAVILVGNPNSQEVHDLMNAGWDFEDMSDKDINDQLFNGKPLYEREKVTVDLPGMWNSDTEQAYVVPSFIVANSEWMMQDRRLFQDVARAAN